jgi:hypothetical protein
MLDDIKEYLSINLKDYENIAINFEINKFLLFVSLALCVVAFVVNYRRAILVDTVKQLLRHNATCEESARTLSELGLSSSRGIRKAIVSDSQLRRMIAIVGESRPTYEEYVKAMKEKKKNEKFDVSSARIYVTSESLDRAKYVYNTYNASLLRTLLSCVLLLSFTACLILLSPSILSLLNDALAA